jgi:hypothetical protein
MTFLFNVLYIVNPADVLFVSLEDVVIPGQVDGLNIGVDKPERSQGFAVFEWRHTAQGHCLPVPQFAKQVTPTDAVGAVDFAAIGEGDANADFASHRSSPL